MAQRAPRRRIVRTPILLPVLLAGHLAAAPALIPPPRAVQGARGRMPVSGATRLVVADRALQPLAELLATECQALTGLRPAVVDAPAAAGDVVLALDAALPGEAYTLEVGDQAELRAPTYDALASATATLLQLLDVDDGDASLPRLRIRDEPFAPYRCLMVDVARKPHALDTLKKLVVLCRFYKIRYLHLHLTDDQAFTFPSTAFPELATPDRHYTLDELRDLEAFAASRGVAIVPEIETPGHSSKMRAVKPFGGPAPGVINMASEETYAALDTLVGEVCDVFRASPYYHMGGDECWLERVGETEDEKAYIARHNLPYPHALYDHFIVRMNEIVRRHGRQLVVWEGFRGRGAKNATIPDNVLVLAWETMYEPPQNLLNSGYTIVNATWRPLYVVGDVTRDPQDVFAWNPYLWKSHWRFAPSYIPIQLDPETRLPDGARLGDRVIGSQMSVWEQTEDEELTRLRWRLPAMAERIWNPAAGRPYARFRADLLALDTKAKLLLSPIRLRHDGLVDPLASGFHHRENWHARPLTVTLAPVFPGSVVRFTTNGTPPGADAPAVAGSLLLTAPRTVLRAQAFDAAGAPLGQSTWETYTYHPVEGRVEADGVFRPNDLERRDGFERGSALTVSLRGPALRGVTLRVATNAPLTAASPVYRRPLRITGDTVLAAGAFDAQGRLIGEPYRRRFEVLRNFERSLTTGCRVTSSKGEADRDDPGVVCDGFVFDRGFWEGGICPGWWQVDLGRTRTLGRIQVVPYWDGSRYYQYRVDVSRNGRDWTRVVDRGTHTETATPKGYTDEIAPTPARYIRVTVTRNSANPGIHLVEVRAWEAEKRP